jgi:hypothetical protein
MSWTGVFTEAPGEQGRNTMELEVYLVQIETQDQEPQPVSVHSSFDGAVEAAKSAGALNVTDPLPKEFWCLSTALGPNTVVSIHKLRLLP